MVESYDGSSTGSEYYEDVDYKAIALTQQQQENEAQNRLQEPTDSYSDDDVVDADNEYDGDNYEEEEHEYVRLEPLTSADVDDLMDLISEPEKENNSNFNLQHPSASTPKTNVNLAASTESNRQFGSDSTDNSNKKRKLKPKQQAQLTEAPLLMCIRCDKMLPEKAGVHAIAAGFRSPAPM